MPQNDDVHQKAFDAACRFLKYRARSIKEIRDALARKRFDGEVIDAVVSRLCDLKLLDDDVFVRAWVSSRRDAGYGIVRIKRELRLKGIDQKLMEQAIDELYGVQERMDAIRELAKRKERTLQGLEAPVRRRRLYSYLISRGFSYDDISRATGDGEE
jgi:regulatory protein